MLIIIHVFSHQKRFETWYIFSAVGPDYKKDYFKGQDRSSAQHSLENTSILVILCLIDISGRYSLPKKLYKVDSVYRLEST